MKIVIIEDEKPAAEKLKRHLLQYDPAIQVLAILSNIKSAIQWIEKNHTLADIYFMDIQLADGLSFEIFNEVEISKPVIFTTAFNQYAIDAFKVNGLDYLLKPITFDQLSNSLEKIERLKTTLGVSPVVQIENLSKTLSKLKTRTFKNRFMIKVGEHIKSITTDEIDLFYAEGRTVYLTTRQEKKFIIDYKLESLEEMIDPAIFFRVNRSIIVNINAIKDVLIYSNSRFKISIERPFTREIIVSREKVAPFKDWFNGQGYG